MRKNYSPKKKKTGKFAFDISPEVFIKENIFVTESSREDTETNLAFYIEIIFPHL